MHPILLMAAVPILLGHLILTVLFIYLHKDHSRILRFFSGFFMLFLAAEFSLLPFDVPVFYVIVLTVCALAAFVVFFYIYFSDQKLKLDLKARKITTAYAIYTGILFLFLITVWIISNISRHSNRITKQKLPTVERMTNSSVSSKTLPSKEKSTPRENSDKSESSGIFPPSQETSTPGGNNDDKAKSSGIFPPSQETSTPGGNNDDKAKSSGIFPSSDENGKIGSNPEDNLDEVEKAKSLKSTKSSTEKSKVGDNEDDAKSLGPTTESSQDKTKTSIAKDSPIKENSFSSVSENPPSSNEAVSSDGVGSEKPSEVSKQPDFSGSSKKSYTDESDLQDLIYDYLLGAMTDKFGTTHDKVLYVRNLYDKHPMDAEKKEDLQNKVYQFRSKVGMNKTKLTPYALTQFMNIILAQNH